MDREKLASAPPWPEPPPAASCRARVRWSLPPGGEATGGQLQTGPIDVFEGDRFRLAQPGRPGDRSGRDEKSVTQLRVRVKADDERLEARTHEAALGRRARPTASA